MTVVEILRVLASAVVLAFAAFRCGQMYQKDRILDYLYSVGEECSGESDISSRAIAAVVAAAVEGIEENC